MNFTIKELKMLHSRISKEAKSTPINSEKIQPLVKFLRKITANLKDLEGSNKFMNIFFATGASKPHPTK